MCIIDSYDIELLLMDLDPDLNSDDYDIHSVFDLEKLDDNRYAMGDDKIVLEIDTDHITKISIVTTDWGPFLCDVFLIIYTVDKKVFITEQEAPFYMTLYNAVAELEGFNYDAVIKSMQTVDNAIFICFEYA